MKTNKSLPLVLFVFATATACRRDMQDQPKYKPLQVSAFFADGRSARPTPAGTIARDELDNNDLFHTGLTNGTWTDTIPARIDISFLHRGQERFNIFCSPCHGRIGDGNGMVARRSFWRPADLITNRVRQEPPGYIFDVVSNGFGAMPDYSDQIPPRDRWAIVAYLRALQLSRGASLADVPPEAQSRIGGSQP